MSVMKCTAAGDAMIFRQLPDTMRALKRCGILSRRASSGFESGDDDPQL